MKSNNNTEITVKELLKDLGESLNLKVIAGEKGIERKITEADINRPGLALAGYFTYFGFKRIQILGKGEIAYLHDLPEEERKNILAKFFTYKIPCFIVDWGSPPPKELILFSNEYNIPVISTPTSTGRLTTQLILYLEERFAAHSLEYGTLVDIYGVGIFLRGKHSVGKSECALELVERGHRLVADDSVLIKRIGTGLIGEPPPATAEVMELRGLGIINIKGLFGISSICQKKEIDLVIALEKWEEGKEYDRTGLDELKTRILDVDIPMIIVPVAPGRNLAVITEVAAINQRAKKIKENTAESFADKQKERLKRRD
ncbi:MAG: HPr(Ser) kinase/phosphatase [bacterium]